MDAGGIVLPPFTQGALTDPAQSYVSPRPQWGDTTGGGSNGQTNWELLLPTDGSLLVGLLNNPSNGTLTVTNSWLWMYLDGLGRALGIPTSSGYSVESSAAANPARAAGGPGTPSTGVVNINNGADSYLILDPTLGAQSGAGLGINQLAGYVADGNGAVLPLHAEIQYTPLYLYPR